MKYIITLLILCTFGQLSAQNPTDTDGNGFINIRTLDDLRWVSENKESWDKNFELDNDIDAEDTKNWNVGDHGADETTPDLAMGFSPIGTDENRFKGFFDGKENKIRNLYINRKGYDNIGFFAYSENESQIENLVLVDCSNSGNYYVGGLVGFNRSDITNCSVSGKVHGATSTGGLIGRNESFIEYCQFNGEVIGENNYTGGLIGISVGYIKKSFTNGSVEGKTNTGGFIGSNIGTVVNCYSSANTVGTVTVGGFVGYH